MVIAIVNGPNLNLLGRREPDLYGHTSFEEHLTLLRRLFPGVEIRYYQSNVEGEIINHLQQAGFGGAHGIVLNAGAYSHTSLAIADTIKALPVPVIAVHITNVHSREPERRTDLLLGACKGNISGLGLDGYTLAMQFLTHSYPAGN
ncbi:MAG: 3-dehydroquinate dehydratase [Bacteroidetes bacterium]|nr:3-dehydroquinate dehydratase [Bacteroidota bacterium]